MYPDRYRLPSVTGHVLALLERRRPGFGPWSTDVEAQLVAEARNAVADAARQFSEVADDPAYWQRLERSFFTVALPRYLQLAREHHELQRRRYGLWRGGDLLSRVVYTGTGILLAVIVVRTAIPDWLGPLPLALILVGPFLPDLQESSFERRYRRRLEALLEEMRLEEKQLEAYRPLVEARVLPLASSPPLESPGMSPEHKEKA